MNQLKFYCKEYQSLFATKFPIVLSNLLVLVVNPVRGTMMCSRIRAQQIKSRPSRLYSDKLTLTHMQTYAPM